MEKICWQITVAAFMQPLQYDLRSPAPKDNSITNAATARSNLDTAIYTAATILQLQSTMEFHRQLIHQQHLQSHLHCGNDPRVANHNGIPSAAHPPAPLAIPFTLRERSYSCKSQWNSVDRTCTKHSWNPIYNAEPIRAWSAHDPTTHETVSQPSHRRGRSSNFITDFVWKNTGFRASAISQKRISCETSFKTPSATPPPAPLAMQLHCGNDPTVANHNGIPSATHPPAPLAIPFTLRERSYSCKSQWNSVDRTCTKNRWNPIYNAEPIRAWSAHDPTTHETVSQPSHRRGRSSRFGDGLCMEKHRVSCICYLSKTHFVRDFLQNSIGNSSTSTTCNAILTLSLTNSFPDILKVTINSVPN